MFCFEAMKHRQWPGTPHAPRWNTGARVVVCLMLLMGTVCAHAASHTDLGTIGPTYAISEPSLLRLIQDQLKRMKASGELDRLNQASQARIQGQIVSPPPVEGISRVREKRSWLYDPSIEVPYPVTDADGRLIVPPGTRINPLEVVGLSQPLLFIDARDPQQVRHAQKVLDDRQGRVKLILTGGSYLDLMRRLKRTVYFDQQGHLTGRLGIHQVPALVTQEGLRLRIEERL
jgi:conjugal transfer pilus assembly protein TraW